MVEIISLVLKEPGLREAAHGGTGLETLLREKASGVLSQPIARKRRGCEEVEATG